MSPPVQSAKIFVNGACKLRPPFLAQIDSSCCRYIYVVQKWYSNIKTGLEKRYWLVVVQLQNIFFGGGGGGKLELLKLLPPWVRELVKGIWTLTNAIYIPTHALSTPTIF